MGKLVLHETKVTRMDTPNGINAATEAIKIPGVVAVGIPWGSLKDPEQPRDQDKPYYSIFQDEAMGYRLQDDEDGTQLGNFASVRDLVVAAQLRHNQKHP